MPLIIDLHIHSRFSRSTSKQLTIPNLYKWAKIKGINVLGTGDFTHPEWFLEMKRDLREAEPGLYQVTEKIAKQIDQELPISIKNREVRFLLSAEISNIYKKNDRVRKMHNLLLAPNFQAAALINRQLSEIGNISSDGRPILGLDSKELLKISLATDPGNYFIPAHIWTPWFSLYGSKSGFDSLVDAFDDLAGEIKTVETGLSSDPYMNWRVKDLDGLTLISNSDAHSPQKLGREANILDCKLNYFDIIDTLKTNDERMLGTIEFFPQEGKYHFDGHRKCDVVFAPEESLKHNLLCPKCGKPLILGVDYRVSQLAENSRGIDYVPKTHKQVEYIIPLMEILAEIQGVKSVASKKITLEYFRLIEQLGDEFTILRSKKIQEIAKVNQVLAEGIRRLRTSQVIVKPGFDGVFGVIKVFEGQKDMEKLKGQNGLGF